MKIKPTGIILAGGLSRRMGRDKAFVELCGQTLISRVLEAIRDVCDDVMIVTNSLDKFGSFGVSLVPDHYPGKGSLGGIYSGLRAAKRDLAMVVACDMPLLSRPLLHYLVGCAEGFDVVIPSSPNSYRVKRQKEGQVTAKDADLHPMHAVYSRKCLAAIEERILAGDLRMISFHPSMNVRIVHSEEIDRFDPRHLSFFNVNNQEDLALAEGILDCHRVPNQTRGA